MSQHLQFPQDQYPPFSMTEHPPESPDSLNMHGFDRSADASMQPFAQYASLTPHGPRIQETLGVLQAFASNHGNPGFLQQQGQVSVPMMNQFIHDRGEPWNPLKMNAGPVYADPRRQYGSLPMTPTFPNFSAFRNPAPPSEVDTVVSRGVGVVLSDSGYGSMARQSVGNRSVYGGDADQNPETQSLIIQFQRGMAQGSLSLEDEPRARETREQKPTIAAPKSSNLVCPHCNMSVKTRSELKKHEARHNKPYKCNISGCPKATEGFSTNNDLERHKRCVHKVRKSDETVYRCDIDQCKDKPKDWPRQDNFKQHLKRKHDLQNVDLSRFMHRSSSLTDLGYLGAPESMVVEARRVERSNSTSPLSWTGLDQGHTVPSGLPDVDVKDASFVQMGMSQFPSHVRLVEERDFASLAGAGGLQCPDQTSLNTAPPQLDMDPVFSEVDIPQAVAQETVTHAEPSPPPPGQTASVGTAFFEGVADMSQCLRPQDMHFSSRQPMQSETDGLPRLRQDDIQDGPQQPDPAVSDEMSVDEDGSAQDSGSEDGDEGTDAEDDDRSQIPYDGRTDLATVGDSEASVTSRVQIKTSPPEHKTGTDTPKPIDLEDETEVRALVQSLMAKGMLDKILAKVGYSKTDESTAKDQKPSSSSSTLADNGRLNKCEDCSKSFLRPCELKKHQKRHEKPYACTFAKCCKKFGSKNDWKRHENSQHFQLEIWRCDEKASDHPDEECGKVCHRRESLKAHLEKEHGISEPAVLDKKLGDCRMGRNFESRFWCGFCQKTIEPTGKGGPAHSERFDHIDNHFNGKGGMPKRDISEWKHVDTDPATSSASPSDMPMKSKGKGKARERDGLSMSLGRNRLPAWLTSSFNNSTPKSLKRPSSPGGEPGASDSRVKRSKSSSAKREIFWTCCLCDNYWGVDITRNCMDNSCNHSCCANCVLFENKSTEKRVNDGLMDG